MSSRPLSPPSPRLSGAEWLAAVSTRELLLWVMLLFAAISIGLLTKSQPQGVPLGKAIDGIEFIAWGCAAILLFRDRAPPPASFTQSIIVLAFLICAVLLPGMLGYAGLTGIGLAAACAAGWSGNQRRAGFIFIAISAQKLWSSVVQMLFADIILRLDTAAAGVAMSVAVPGSTWSGNMLRPPNGVGVTVGAACSSFANLSLVCLCFGSLLALDGGRFNRRAFIALAGVCMAVVALNTTRLLLTAQSLAGYRYWHDGAGSELFGIGMTVVSIVLCSVGSRWASRRA